MQTGKLRTSLSRTGLSGPVHARTAHKTAAAVQSTRNAVKTTKPKTKSNSRATNSSRRVSRARVKRVKPVTTSAVVHRACDCKQLGTGLSTTTANSVSVEDSLIRGCQGSMWGLRLSAAGLDL